MSCTPTRILLSNSAVTTMNVTLTTDPGDGTSVTFQVDGLGITETETTTGAVAVFTITANTAGNNSLWDATLQVGTNTAVEASAQAVETNGAQTIGVTLSDAAVTYCSPLAGGGGGDATSLTGPVLFNAKNATGVTITKGSVVYIDGVSGNTPTVALADADDASKMPAFGLAYADLADAETGSIITFGDITNVDTDGFALDNPLYVSTTAGALTQTKPAGESSLIQNIGLVTRVQQSAGRIKVTGAGRSNDTPNLDDGNIFIGNASNQVTTTALSTLTGVTSVTAGAGLTGGTITATGTIAHASGSFVGSEEYPVRIVLDAFGHVQVNESETTAAAYRTAIGADDAANLTTGKVPDARLNIGTTAGDLIVLDGSAKLPAVDGSQLTNLPSGGSTDYASRPTATANTFRMWHDFLDVTPDRTFSTTPAFWMNSGGSGISLIEDYTDATSRGASDVLMNSSSDRFTYWGGMALSGLNKASGDELLWETRVRIDDTSSSTGRFTLGVVDREDGLNYNDSPPTDTYQSFASTQIVVNFAETNVRVGKVATGSGTPTMTDLGSSYPVSNYIDTAWHRVGVHAKYNSANTNWDIDFYLNGVKVNSQTLVFLSGVVPFVGSKSVDSGQYNLRYDWISYQYTVGNLISDRTTHLTL